LAGFFTFQPSEIAKPVLVLFLAWFLHTRLDAMRDWKHTLLRAAIMPVVFVVLIVAARPGHGAGAGRRDRHDAGAGRNGVEVSACRASAPRCPAGRAAALVPWRLAAHAGLSQSQLRSQGIRASTSASR
jgi:hypothetical protein